MAGDIISSLPDTILCHILSFLPTKEAVATSVLSKRWMPMWRSVPTLDFDDADYHFGSKEAYSRFVQSVYAVILSRDFYQPIQKLRLRCHSSHFDDRSSVGVWVNSALQRQVEHLDISLRYGADLKLPTNNLPSFFRCTTLVVLKLHGLELKPFSSVDVDFPLLKVLHLELLRLPARESLVELLSGCPVLEDLKARDISFYDIITGRELKMPKLVRADISVKRDNFFLMEAISNVESLHLHEIDLRISHAVLGANPYVFPMFPNLTHLELVYEFGNDDWFQTMELLKYCPKLQILVISQSYFHHINLDGVEEEIGNWKYPPSVPKCILLHLKRCYLNDYRGTKGEFQFARYIMRNGRFLKRMTICSSTAVNQRGKLKNLKELSSCTRRSRTCKLSFK